MNVSIGREKEEEDLRDVAALAIMWATDWLDRIHTFHEAFVMKPFDSSFINNTKDAIFHFRRLNIAYEAYHEIPNSADLEKMLLEFEFISEHLTRGIIDALVDTLQYISQYYIMVRKCIAGEIREGSLPDDVELLEKLDKAIGFCKRETFSLRRGALNRITKIDAKGVRIFNMEYGTYIPDTLQKCKEYLEELIGGLTQPIGKELLQFVEKAISEDCGLHRITPQNERTLNTISQKYKCQVIALKLINGMEETLPFEKLDKDRRWILYPVVKAASSFSVQSSGRRYLFRSSEERLFPKASTPPRRAH